MATNNDGKKLKVTVFLIKDGYDKIEDFITVKDFKTVVVKAGSKEVGTLIYKGGFQSKPGWVAIFDEIPGFDSKGIWNQSSKAILALKHDGRWFCFTFGYARHLIDELELAQAALAESGVDLWVLAASCRVNDEHAKKLEADAHQLNVEVLLLDMGNDGLPRLAVLMAAFPDAVEKWIGLHSVGQPSVPLGEALATIAVDRKLRFVAASWQSTKRALNREKKRKDHLFGLSVPKGQILPFVEF